MHDKTVRLPFSAPFRWDALTAFLSARTIDGIDSFVDGRYRRGDVTITYGDALLMHVSPRDPRPATRDLVIRARRMFDLDADPIAIDEVLRKDPILPHRPGIRVPGAWEPFEVAVRAIVGQQISVRATTTIMNRLAPVLTPAQLAEADIVGMPRSRADTVRRLAAAWDSLSFRAERGILTSKRGDSSSGSLAHARDDKDALIAIRGIGPWTANYIAMRAFGDRDAFPDSDLVLRKAAVTLGIDNLLQRAERWRPYRAYAAILLWETM